MRNSLARSAVTVFLSVLATIACAQVTVNFPAKGDWSVWHSPGPVGAAPETAVETLENKVILPTPPGAKTGFLVAHDHLRGNIAVIPFATAGAEWKLSEKDFTLIHEVIVKVTHQGEPVASANVSFTTKKGTTSTLLTPSDAGEIKFYAVTPGQAKIEIKTKYKGVDVNAPVQIFEIPFNRPDLIPSLEFAVASQVDTVGSTSEATSDGKTKSSPEKGNSDPKPVSQEPKAQPAQSQGNPFLNFLGAIFSLAIILGAAYFIFKFVTQNKDKINAQLDHIGVQIPDDSLPQPSPDAATPLPSQPSSPKAEPIFLGDDAQISAAPISGVATAGVIQAGVSNPRLVNLTTGTSVSLVEGDHVISREAGSPYSFPSDASISRNHASLNFENGIFTVSDAGSTNGTYVNSVRISGATVLKVGDQIQVGATVLRVEGL